GRLVDAALQRDDGVSADDVGDVGSIDAAKDSAQDLRLPVVGIGGGQDEHAGALLDDAGGGAGDAVADHAADRRRGGGTGRSVDGDRAVGAVEVERILEVDRVVGGGGCEVE